MYLLLWMVRAVEQRFTPSLYPSVSFNKPKVGFVLLYRQDVLYKLCTCVSIFTHLVLCVVFTFTSSSTTFMKLNQMQIVEIFASCATVSHLGHTWRGP